MDADKRHELEENELASFLVGAKTWWAKHGTRVLSVLLVIVVAWFGWNLYQKRAREARETAWSNLANATSPEALKQAAQSYADPAYQAMAWLKAGDLLLGRAITPPEAPPEAGAAGTPTTQPADPAPVSDPAADLDEAETLYEKVLGRAEADPVFKLNARLGLAAIAETRGHSDEAAQQYELIQKEAGEHYEAIAQQAKARQARLVELARPVVFGAEPPPEAPKGPEAPEAPDAPTAPMTQPMGD
ncbi:MAG: hypothetical protein WD042_03805 [Phycisphaeraceae bacterium]